MRSLPEKICLVIPCYNEAARLDLNEFVTTAPSDCSFLFVDDGSEDNTLEILKKFTAKNLYVLHLEKNSGKGEAIRQGMLYLKNLPIFKEITWVGYWDADLATPLSELSGFLQYTQLYDQPIDAVWGCKVMKLGSQIKRVLIRHYMSRVFVSMISNLLHTECYDPICGAKLFKKELIEPSFREPFISRWIFDVEIYLRIRHRKIIEYPLKSWHEIPGSKVRIIPVAIRTLLEIAKIRKKYKDPTKK